MRITSDDERLRLIREDHSGTGMLSDTTLMIEEIADILAYLSTLDVKHPQRAAINDDEVLVDLGGGLQCVGSRRSLLLTMWQS